MWRVTAVGAQKPTALLSRTMVIYMTLLLTTMCCCCCCCCSASAVKHDISGDAGRRVLLPCNCSGRYDAVIWQTSESKKVVYSQDRNEVYAQYQDRSQIVDKTNCSLWLSNISLVDSGVYDCYASLKIGGAEYPQERAKVNLTVIEKRSDEPTAAEKFGVDLKNELSVGIPILLVALIVALGWIITRRFRKQNNRNRIEIPNTDYEDEPSKPEEKV